VANGCAQTVLGGMGVDDLRRSGVVRAVARVSTRARLAAGLCLFGAVEGALGG
jgi:hypothetical protein